MTSIFTLDFTVSAFIVYRHQVLLAHHKKLASWLPVGGHIEPNEDPQQALFREILEETGLTTDLLTPLSTRLHSKSTPRTQFLYTPNYLDVHQITPTHRHIGLVYFLLSKTKIVHLDPRQHHQLIWFSKSKLTSPDYHLYPEIIDYAHQSLKLASTW